MVSWAKTLVVRLANIFRKHKRFLLACLTATTAYATLSLRDGSTEAWSRGWLFFDHGWPWLYMTRYPDEARWGERWRVWSGIYEFHYTTLLWNLLFAVGLSLLLTCLWRVHCLRSSRWRMSLREMLLVVVVLCIAMGGFTHFRRQHVLEESYLLELEKIGFRTGPDFRLIPWFIQPLRDLRMINDDNWYYLDVEWEEKSGSEWAPTSLTSTDINQIMVEQVSKGIRLSLVRDVFIADSKLDNQGVEMLCRWAPQCTRLGLYGCEKVDDEGISIIARHLPRLRELNLSQTGITDKGLSVIARHLTGLRELSLAQTGITDEGIRRVSENHSIEYIDIGGVGDLTTEKSIKYILELPRLKTLSIPKHWVVNEQDQQELNRRKIELIQGWHH